MIVGLAEGKTIPETVVELMVETVEKTNQIIRARLLESNANMSMFNRCRWELSRLWQWLICQTNRLGKLHSL
ncbi:hypothetical protein Q8A67_021673 [Cirrhinus molitorella]|uniref:Uncharacterized protein n=1 Tax=Cirrhinus molitorella TaxID=172907 RepID=A0AA88PB64_9TELE|nr:hypothetical protein Q8A67_021673 [Cirrhinus molitorella]